MPTASDRQVQPALACEANGRDDIGDLLGAYDHLGPAVEHAVLHGTRFVVTGIIRGDHGRADLLSKTLEAGLGH
jgi:hypothetical protein